MQHIKITAIHKDDSLYTEKKVFVGETGYIRNLELSKAGPGWLSVDIKPDSKKLREEYGKVTVFYAVKLELV